MGQQASRAGVESPLPHEITAVEGPKGLFFHDSIIPPHSHTRESEAESTKSYHQIKAPGWVKLLFRVG